jgi:hypothetical protein
MPRAESRTRLLAALTLLAGAIATVGVVAWRARVDPGTAWLASDGTACWIVYPTPADMRARPLVEMTTEFRRPFHLDRTPTAAAVSIRAFRRAQVVLNGRRVRLEGEEQGWKETRRADVTQLLRQGDNELSVTVGNDAGPPALWLSLDAGEQTIETGPAWTASIAGSAWRGAVPATEPPGRERIDPERKLISPWRALGLQMGTLLTFALISCAVAWWGVLARRPLPGGPWSPRGRVGLPVVLGVIGALWIALLSNNATQLPLQIGFDAGQHLEYVQYVLRRHAIPLADEGWQMFQPPLYYLVAALGLGAAGLDVSSPGAPAVLRIIGFAASLANIVFVGLFLRRMFPTRTWMQVVGLLVAGFLPPMLYLSHFPTNEPLAAALSSAALLATATMLDSEDWSFRRAAALGVLLGLALLAKFSTLLLLPCVFGALAVRVAGSPRALRARRWTRVASAAAVALAVSGWHFVRVWQRFGDPFVGGWEARPGLGWWLDPGFRTIRHFTRFGRVFSEPAFAGLDGFWNGMYSTMWGDGMLSGLASTAPLPPWWSPGLHAAGYVLALVPVSLIVAGLMSTTARFIRRPEAVDVLLLLFPALILAALVIMSVRVPAAAQDKAFYGLMGLAPFAALAARGAAVLAGATRWRQVLLFSLLGTWAATSYATYWMDGDSPNVAMIQAVSRLGRSDEAGGLAVLRGLVRRDPTNWSARVALARVLTDGRHSWGEVDALLRPEDPDPALAERHLAIALSAEARGRVGLASDAALRAVVLDPSQALGWTVLAGLREDVNDGPGAVAAWREVLRLEPQNREAHQSLARLLARSGDEEGGRFHRALAARLPR